MAGHQGSNLSILQSPNETDFSVSLKTLIGCAPILGNKLEDRAKVRQAQNPDLLNYWFENSKRHISNRNVLDGFCVAPFDVLVEETADGHHFHIIELNGTGIGGLTNLPNHTVREVLYSLGKMVENLPVQPLILVAISGKEDEKAPRLNRMMHEKILYVDTLQQKMEQKFGRSSVRVCVDSTSRIDIPEGPTVILGYMKDLLDQIELNSFGEIFFQSRKINGVVNDRFFLNITQKFQDRVYTDDIVVMNKSYLPGANKGTAYQLMNEYFKKENPSCFPKEVDFMEVASLSELENKVLERVAQGIPTLIKPCGTGLGHGIEFFLNRDESEQEIRKRIRDSVQMVSEFYGIEKGAFPYTISGFIDTKVVQGDHNLKGHKFELRVVVYRHDDYIAAVPSIAKISCSTYDSLKQDHMSLINNVTASTTATQKAGNDFMLPLANLETLHTLGLKAGEITELAQGCSGLMEYILRELDARPERFGYSNQHHGISLVGARRR